MHFDYTTELQNKILFFFTPLCPTLNVTGFCNFSPYLRVTTFYGFKMYGNIEFDDLQQLRYTRKH